MYLRPLGSRLNGLPTRLHPLTSMSPSPHEPRVRPRTSLSVSGLRAPVPELPGFEASHAKSSNAKTPSLCYLVSGANRGGARLRRELPSAKIGNTVPMMWDPPDLNKIAESVRPRLGGAHAWPLGPLPIQTGLFPRNRMSIIDRARSESARHDEPAGAVLQRRSSSDRGLRRFVWTQPPSRPQLPARAGRPPRTTKV